MKDSVFSSAFLGNYFTFKKLQIVQDAGHVGNFMAGGVAHMITWAAFIPIDHVKTQVQKGDKSVTVRSVVSNTIRSGQYKTLWRGIGPALLRIFPMSGTGMVVYEFVRNLIKEDV